EVECVSASQTSPFCGSTDKAVTTLYSPDPGAETSAPSSARDANSGKTRYSRSGAIVDSQTGWLTRTFTSALAVASESDAVTRKLSSWRVTGAEKLTRRDEPSSAVRATGCPRVCVQPK